MDCDDGLDKWILRQRAHKARQKYLARANEQIKQAPVIDFKQASKLKRVFYMANQVKKSQMVAIMHNRKLGEYGIKEEKAKSEL